MWVLWNFKKLHGNMEAYKNNLLQTIYIELACPLWPQFLVLQPELVIKIEMIGSLYQNFKVLCPFPARTLR